MTEVTYYEALVPPWADSAMTVAVEGNPVFTLYLKAVNFSAQRYYLGMDFFRPPPLSALRSFKKTFEESTEGFELEAMVEKKDDTSIRFCRFFGFTRIPDYEVNQHYVYERLG